AALAGIDTVFHLAGKAHALAETQQSVDEYFHTNTDATRRLLEACREQGVQRLVYFSSTKAAGDLDGVMDETVSAEPTTPYGQSKRAAERLVLDGGYLPYPVVIRPAMVYGDSEKGNLSKMIRSIRAGTFPSLPDLPNRRSMVHVDDVVQAALLAAERSAAAGEIYIVTDGEAYSTRQIYAWVCEALDQRVPPWHVPLWLLQMLAIVGDGIGSVRGRRFMFDSDVLAKLCGSAHYSSAKITRELGFQPQRNLHEALPEIVDYLAQSCVVS
ncbi:MAG: NAD-dependent epimerase/dehydratase family protein, partial [Mariprofundales bacterium]|nr:NAD-dependent epimerase/dehydratase family protein [Mariprofundales bacterium]